MDCCVRNEAIYDYCLSSITVVVVYVLIQAEVPSNVETAACDIQLPVEVTGGHIRPVVVLKRLDLTR